MCVVLPQITTTRVAEVLGKEAQARVAQGRVAQGRLAQGKVDRSAYAHACALSKENISLHKYMHSQSCWARHPALTVNVHTGG